MILEQRFPCVKMGETVFRRSGGIWALHSAYHYSISRHSCV